MAFHKNKNNIQNIIKNSKGLNYKQQTNEENDWKKKAKYKISLVF